VAAVIEAENRKSGAAGALELLRRAGYDVAGTPYARFIERYFAGG